MQDNKTREEIRQLLQQLEEQEPRIYELGTPQIEETAEVQRLVGLGTQIVSYLTEMLKTESAKRAAYIVFVLGKLGGSNALEAIREARETYRNKPKKDQWDFAVIGQCNAAIDALSRSER